MFINIFQHWLPVALIAGLIFYLSGLPDLKSGFQPIWDLVLRKIGHAVIFSVLSFFTIKAFHHGHRFSLGVAILGALLGVVLYAAGDEYHQLFTQGRHGEWTDVLIDIVGAGLAAAIALHYWHQPKRRRT